MSEEELLESFLEEASEHIENLNTNILEMEGDPSNDEYINEVFRAAHSLKGTSGSLGFVRMQKLTHDMESVLSLIRDHKLEVDSDKIDLLFRCLDGIMGYIDNIRNTGTEGENDYKEILDELNSYLDGGDKASAPDKEKKEEKASDKESDTHSETENTGEHDGASSIQDNINAVLSLKEFEINAIKDAKSDGQKCFLVTIVIDSECLLKSVRAFMVFKKLEGKAEIMKLSPSAQDIEDEKFEFDFSMLILTDMDKAAIQKRISKIAELSQIDIKEYQAEDFVNNTKVVTSDEESSGKEESSPKEKEQEAPKGPAAEAKTKVKKPVASHSVRVDIDKLNKMMNLVSELIIQKNGIVATASAITESTHENSLINAYHQDMDHLNLITNSIHETVMQMRMVPIDNVFNRYPRMMRDLSKKLGKDIDLIITGEETEIDRTLVDELSDPLMHMIRNSADHGIEDKETRIKNGKPEKGTVRLEAEQIGDNVMIRISDDGAGINTEKVVQKAVQNGRLTAEEAENISEEKAADLIFLPSLSTAEKVSDISGRGVGLDVVRSKIEGLGGDVTVESELGKGSTFIIRLPLTLAIVKALMVEVCNEIFAIPTSSISIVEIIPIQDVNYIQEKPFINLRGEVIPLLYLREFFCLDDKMDFIDTANKELLKKEEVEERRSMVGDDSILVTVVKKGKKTLGIVMDGYIGQQEIVIKPMGEYINSPKAISGATILGNGDIALIIDPYALF